MQKVGFLASLRHHSSWCTGDSMSLPEDFEHIFTDFGFSYFKTVETRELYADLGDLDALIKDVRLRALIRS